MILSEKQLTSKLFPSCKNYIKFSWWLMYQKTICQENKKWKKKAKNKNQKQNNVTKLIKKTLKIDRKSIKESFWRKEN